MHLKLRFRYFDGLTVYENEGSMEEHAVKTGHSFAMPSNLQIRLFGDFRLTCDDNPVAGVHATRLQSLLAYLLLHRDAVHSRRYLAFTFWPDSTESQALTNLRQVLHLLRQALPEPDRWLEADSRNIRWKPDSPFSLDVAEFEQLMAQAKKAQETNQKSTLAEALEQAVDLYRGDLFPECYEEWIDPIRASLKKEYAAALQNLTGHFENNRNYPKAILFAERLLMCDNLREQSWSDLMRLHALNGDRTGAIGVYHECRAILKHELDIEPGSSIRNLYNQLAQNEQPPDTVSGTDSKKKEELLPLIGRQQEWLRLRTLWNQTKEQHSRLVIISGEAGIGKTRLALEMVNWASRQHYTTASARSYRAENPLAYAPVSEWLRSEKIRAYLTGLDPVYLSEAARLLPELLAENRDIPPPSPVTDSLQRRHLFESLSRAILSAPTPILLFLDDLQWCDRETLDWIQFLIHSASEEPIFILGTVRIEEVDPDHPLRSIVHSLHRKEQVSEIELLPLSVNETGRLAEQVFGDNLEEDVRARLYEESEGNPLFLIENIQASIAGGQPEPEVEEATQNYALLSQGKHGLVKDKVRQIIRSRLSMVSSEAQKMASCASALGRNFTMDLLEKITELSREELVAALDELLLRRIFREQDDGMFDFSHDKLREVAYTSMNRMERSLIHEKIARALALIHRSNTEPVSSRLAYHYERAGDVEEAIRYYEQAAGLAQQIYALQEAMQNLNRALELLQTLQESTDRDRRELFIRLKVGPLLVATKGYHASDVTEDYHRIHQLSRRFGRDESPPVLRNRAISLIVRGDLNEAFTLGEQLLEIADRKKQSVLKVEGHYVAGVSSFWLGNFPQSKNHLLKALEWFDPEQLQTHLDFFAQHPGVICRVRLAFTLLLMGYPEQADKHCQQAIDEAESCGHPYSLVYALMFCARVKSETGDFESAVKRITECIALTEERGFKQFQLISGVVRSRFRFRTEGDSAYVEEIQNRLKRLRESGEQLEDPLNTNMVARANLELGHTAPALEMVNKALDLVKKRGEAYYHAEILRTKGNILFELDENDPKAEQHYLKALETAGTQGAMLFELRAACDLAELWRRQNRTEAAYDLLTEIYGRFTEGFDTPDLQQAKQWIDELTA